MKSYINSLALTNFKSFEKLKSVPFRDLNVIVGANSSGKSSFIEALEFVKDISEEYLENAIQMHGGRRFIETFGTNSPTSISLTYRTNRIDLFFARGETKTEAVIKYTFAITFIDDRNFKISSETVIIDFDIDPKVTFKIRRLASGRYSIIRNPQVLNNDIKNKLPYFFNEDKLDRLQQLLQHLVENRKKSLLIDPKGFLSLYGLENQLRFYDIDPKRPKKATPITGKVELEKDGSNLALVLHHILQDSEKKKKLITLLKFALPFAESFNTVDKLDKSLYFTMEESFSAGTEIPAALVSDGTMSVLAIIVALFFEKGSVVVLEEPERNIHSSLMNKLVQLMIEASKNKQIIVTTHNPLLVKWAGVENILVAYRGNNGKSSISPLNDDKTIKNYISQDIGIDDLISNNLLRN